MPYILVAKRTGESTLGHKTDLYPAVARSNTAAGRGVPVDEKIHTKNMI